MIRYLILSNLSFVLFYVIYKILLQNDTFFKWRRFYLWFALVFSLLYPFAKWKIVSHNQSLSGVIISKADTVFNSTGILLNEVTIQACLKSLGGSSDIYR